MTLALQDQKAFRVVEAKQIYKKDKTNSFDIMRKTLRKILKMAHIVCLSVYYFSVQQVNYSVIYIHKMKAVYLQ